MQFDYKIENNEVCILRCYGEAGKVKLPGQLEGYPVTALGRYIFSGAYDGDGGRQAVCADMLEEVILRKRYGQSVIMHFTGADSLHVWRCIRESVRSAGEHLPDVQNYPG